MAELYGLDLDLVTAIVMTESSGDPNAHRFEPGTDKYLYFAREHADRLQIPYEEEKRNQMTSWGLMQLMGFVARELNFTNRLEDLMAVEAGLFYGCKKLYQVAHRYDIESDVIAAYNAGKPRKEKSGMYRNQRYVDKVDRYLRELRKLA